VFNSVSSHWCCVQLRLLSLVLCSTTSPLIGAVFNSVSSHWCCVQLRLLSLVLCSTPSPHTCGSLVLCSTPSPLIRAVFNSVSSHLWVIGAVFNSVSSHSCCVQLCLLTPVGHWCCVQLRLLSLVLCSTPSPHTCGSRASSIARRQSAAKRTGTPMTWWGDARVTSAAPELHARGFKSEPYTVRYRFRILIHQG
jgi:hypothetical protein